MVITYHRQKATLIFLVQGYLWLSHTTGRKLYWYSSYIACSTAAARKTKHTNIQYKKEQTDRQRTNNNKNKKIQHTRWSLTTDREAVKAILIFLVRRLFDLQPLEGAVVPPGVVVPGLAHALVPASPEPEPHQGLALQNPTRRHQHNAGNQRRWKAQSNEAWTLTGILPEKIKFTGFNITAWAIADLVKSGKFYRQSVRNTKRANLLICLTGSKKQQQNAEQWLVRERVCVGVGVGVGVGGGGCVHVCFKCHTGLNNV